MRAVLHERDEAKLREGAVPPAGARPAKRRRVVRFIGHIQRAAVQAHQPQSVIPRPFARRTGDRLHHLVMQLAHHFPAQARARLGDPGPTSDLDPDRGTEQPLHTFQQAAQHFAIGGAHVERQGDDVVHYNRRRQITLA
jgi:hypothetical protein